MIESKQSLTRKFRLGIFADGYVGKKIVEFILSNNSEHLRVLVSVRRDFFDDFPSINFKFEKFVYEELDHAELVKQLKSLELDVLVLAWWPFIIDSDLCQVARVATLNTHPSYLPFGRGKDPNFWAIVKESLFGVSIHHVSPQIDSGDIAFREKIPIDWEDTGMTLYQQAQRSIVSLFQRSYAEISELRIPRIPQDLSSGSFHRRSELEPSSMIDLNATYVARKLLNLLRARTFAPHPACYFYEGEQKFEVRIQISKVVDTNKST